jgi:site-specific recombinase XerD
LVRISATQHEFKDKFGKNIDEYESFQRSIRTLAPNTIKCYHSRLIRFFLFINEDPDTVIKNRQKDIADADIFNVNRYEIKVTQYVKYLQEKDEDVQSSLNRIQGFFTNNSKRLSLELTKLDLSSESKRIKYSPTSDEIRKLLSYADSSRDKFIVCVAFQNGVAPVDVANLKLGEYPTEPWAYYKKKRSKTKKYWHGVSTPETSRYLKDYLTKTQKTHNSSSAKNVPLLYGREGPMNSATVSLVIEKLIQKSGLSENPNFIPKCLRDGLEDALVDADANIKTKESIMGHSGDIQHAYGSATRLEERVVETMKKVYPHIQLDKDATVPGQMVVAAEVLERFLALEPKIEMIEKMFNEMSQRKN